MDVLGGPTAMSKDAGRVVLRASLVCWFFVRKAMFLRESSSVNVWQFSLSCFSLGIIFIHVSRQRNSTKFITSPGFLLIFLTFWKAFSHLSPGPLRPSAASRASFVESTGWAKGAEQLLEMLTLVTWILMAMEDIYDTKNMEKKKRLVR